MRTNAETSDDSPPLRILFVNAADTSRHVASANTAIYPNLGLLTLMSALASEQRNGRATYELGYLDGTVYGNELIERHVRQQADGLFAICFSVLTANYGASVAMANAACAANPRVTVVFGNDHFSARHRQILERQPNVHFGFYGSDVVEGFCRFIDALATGYTEPLGRFPGLVYRDASGRVARNAEDPDEYARLPLVDYALADRTLPHTARYLDGQQRTYHFMRGRRLRSQVVDIGRGCIKFAGPRRSDVPVNACDFCGIIPGSKPIISKTVQRAWEVLENAYRQGYNYFYVTADELPLTLWNLLRGMANEVPDWYRELDAASRPKMFGYARAEGFATGPERIHAIIEVLGFDHFFIGFDGLSDVSLNVMNKGPVRGGVRGLMEHNAKALQMVVERGALITAGIVVSHLGITRSILEANFVQLEEMVSRHPKTFAALDFGPLCPIPGSQSFHYLTDPSYAERKATAYGLRVDRAYLESVKGKYIDGDAFDMDELVDDFTRGCCPDITPALLSEYLRRIEDLATRHSIVVGGGV